MKLASAVALHAGGPGSGCRGPNCGRPVNSSNHKGLTENGWQHKENRIEKGKEVSVYEHPRQPGHQIIVHESGRTRMVRPKGQQATLPLKQEGKVRGYQIEKDERKLPGGTGLTDRGLGSLNIWKGGKHAGSIDQRKDGSYNVWVEKGMSKYDQHQHIVDSPQELQSIVKQLFGVDVGGHHMAHLATTTDKLQKFYGKLMQGPVDQ